MIMSKEKAKFTPGPWKVVVGTDAVVVLPDGRSINCGDAVYHPENIELATLIGSAPDMLCRLDSIDGFLEALILHLQDDPSFALIVNHARSEQNHIQSLISKAKGIEE